jgi:Ca2+-binding EF-hand superfamily protein
LKKIIQDEEEELTKESKTPSLVLNLLDKDGDGDVDMHDFIQ